MDVRLTTNPPVSEKQLDALFSAAWPDHESRDFGPVLARSLAYVCAFDADQLIAFVNVAWDGGVHAFLLDPTVHPDYRRRGVGMRLVTKAATEARERGAEWLHVDYESQLGEFYRRCGFRPTSAGLIRLSGDTERRPPRGVPKALFSKRSWYDVWFPNLAPSAETMKLGQDAATPAQWAAFTRKYKAEMAAPEAKHDLGLLAALSNTTNFSVGCYCEDESHCHRSILKQLLIENGAKVEQ